MKQPTDEQIEKWIDDSFLESNSSKVSGKLNVVHFANGFRRAVQWLINWQKSQPLEVFLIRPKESDVVACVCRTKEDAEKTIASLKKTYENEFYFTSVII